MAKSNHCLQTLNQLAYPFLPPVEQHLEVHLHSQKWTLGRLAEPVHPESSFQLGVLDLTIAAWEV
jgi:hypothetical protein